MVPFNVYVDGESHFIRSQECWKRIHGGSLEEITNYVPVFGSVIPAHQQVLFGPPPSVHHGAKFFWDSRFAALAQTRRDYFIGRGVYFTACTGDENSAHQLRLFIRQQDFEPQVILELKKLADQRANLLNSVGVIEKAKGVDIGLATRLVEDAHANTFDGCLLFTSEVDFMPAIRAVRRIGKEVTVLGYRDGLSHNSPLEYEPDLFFDLEKVLADWYRPKRS